MGNLHDYWAIKAIRDARKRLVEMANETDKSRKRKLRLLLGECHACYYVLGSRIAGQGFTEYTCRLCEQKRMHPNTGVPKLCEQCASKANRCRRCMADLTAVEKEAKRGGKSE